MSTTHKTNQLAALLNGMTAIEKHQLLASAGIASKAEVVVVSRTDDYNGTKMIRLDVPDSRFMRMGLEKFRRLFVDEVQSIVSQCNAIDFEAEYVAPAEGDKADDSTDEA